MLDRAAPRPGDRVLELACGAGGLGLEVAARLGGRGEVVMSDAVEEMRSIAARRARARGLANVRTAVFDAEAIGQPDDTYDVVLCREGLMLAVDPPAAAGEIARVTRPGGRVAVSVWGTPAQNPWLRLAADAVAEHVGRTCPPAAPGHSRWAIGPGCAPSSLTPAWSTSPSRRSRARSACRPSMRDGRGCRRSAGRWSQASPLSPTTREPL
jgi:SAM-dependent methyltransferase